MKYIMISEKYRNAFSEVSIILEHLRKEDYDKISKELIEAIEENKNNEYKFVLQQNVELKDQNLMPETRAILFNLFYDYYADEKQKAIIQDIWRVQDRKDDLEKQGKYDIDVFKDNRNKSSIEESETTAENTEENIENGDNNKIAVKKESIIISIFKRIINLFKK